MIHNYTEGFATGGEGQVFEDESEILQKKGHDVCKLICSNSEAIETNLYGKFKAFWHAPWSPDGYERVSKLIAEFRPDIIHAHNYFLVLSPSIFGAAKDNGIPIVVTLHNYRLVSPCSQLLRKGKICQLCVAQNPWRIMLYSCYRNNILYSVLRYRFYYLSQRRHDWLSHIDKFITLTEFSRQMHIRGGLPADKIVVKPNSCPDPLREQPFMEPGHGALFIGRISPEKGVENLIEAWREIQYPLDILGDGNLRKFLEASAPSDVTFHGNLSRSEIFEKLKGCAFLIMPSVCYEGLPLVLIEALASGRPIVASRRGAMEYVVDDGATGLLFDPDSIPDLREKVRKMISNGEKRKHYGMAARKRYLECYTPMRTYDYLMQIYENVLSKA